MIIEENFSINAPIQQVWDFFFDIERVSKCVPGAEVRELDADNYEGTIKIKVGPLGASFSGKVTLTNRVPPGLIEATLQGKDKLTGSTVQGKFTSHLREAAPEQTEVSYRVDVAIRGRLGQFGQTVIQDTARRLSAEFLNCTRAHLEPHEDGTEPAAISSQQAGRMAARALTGAVLKATGDSLKQIFKSPKEGQIEAEEPAEE